MIGYYCWIKKIVHQVGCKISILYHDARSKIHQIKKTLFGSGCWGFIPLADRSTKNFTQSLGKYDTAVWAVLSVFRRYKPPPSVWQKTKRFVQIIFDISKAEPGPFKCCSFIYCHVYFYVSILISYVQSLPYFLPLFSIYFLTFLFCCLHLISVTLFVFLLSVCLPFVLLFYCISIVLYYFHLQRMAYPLFRYRTPHCSDPVPIMLWLA
jgi:hypothetical protein